MILAAVGLAYSNTLSVPFFFDDLTNVGENRSIRSLWPIWPVFLVNTEEVSGVHNRPAVFLSFALNYAVSGLEPFAYHVVNLAIHMAASLALLGIVRRTLLLPGMDRFAHVATPLALGIALLWALHPLHTQGVTSVAQRYEIMMGLFYLLTLYSTIRAATSTRPRPWIIASVACCVVALGSKEVAVSLPLVVLLYDRAFLAGSFHKALDQRRWLYLGLAVAWSLFVVWQQFTPPKPWAGDQTGTTWYEYALSQPGVILHYLRLSFWPTGQCLDYAWPVARSAAEIVPQAIAIAALGGATLWATVQHPRWGFLGAWFFLILAPTSSILPIADLAVEHRMYLPLASVVVATVFAAVGCLVNTVKLSPAAWWLLLAPIVCVAVILGTASFNRNRVYASPLTVWTDVVTKRPENSRAFSNLGTVHYNAGRFEEAMYCFQEATRLSPSWTQVSCMAGRAAEKLGQADRAMAYYLRALTLDADYPDAHIDLGRLLRKVDPERAAKHLRLALRARPSSSEAHINLGAIVMSKEPHLAERHFRLALHHDPYHAEAHNNLANCLARRGQLEDAVRHYRRAVELKPDYLNAQCNLEIVERWRTEARSAAP